MAAQKDEVLCGSSTPKPPLQFSIRGRGGIHLLSLSPPLSSSSLHLPDIFAPPSSAAAASAASAAAPLSAIKSSSGSFSSPYLIPVDESALYSPNGRFFATLRSDGVYLFDSSATPLRSDSGASKAPSSITKINRPNVLFAQFSPCGSYLTTWERPKSASPSDNLFIWKVFGGEMLWKIIHTKEFTNDSWPVQWSDDGKYFAYLTTNELKILQSSSPDTGKPFARISESGIKSFAWAPVIDHQYRIAAFIPQYSANPASVNIYSINDSSVSISANRQFFKADDAILRWSPLGYALLIQSSTETDKTGKSYYGESHLHLLYANGSLSTAVPFGTNDGPIQDVCWSPNGKEFLAIQGFQPAKTILFSAIDEKLIPVRDYGHAARNTIRFSPHGRFLMLGAFGSLAGEMDFWDHYKFKKFCTAKDGDGAKSFQWTPDGRYFVTASLRPWRRVDNGVKVWSYYGELIHQQKFDELWQFDCKPAPINSYENLPPSPRIKDRMKKLGTAIDANAPALSLNAGTGSVGGASNAKYVPPHLRGKGAAASSGTNLLHKEFADKGGPKKISAVDAAKQGVGKVIEDEARKAQQKAEKEAKKKREQEEAERKRKEEEENERKAKEAAVFDDEGALLKKIRAAQKKLKQIEELKAKDTVSADEKNKIAKENQLIDEIKEWNTHLQRVQSQKR